ncbi:nitroreductase family protein [Emcibacter nanhaiensis]|uniref:Putative NAD(P)H nitroreductase n=1 Tax=Emcibacter nanhaiensis TaxID=1505037 RepID=A0A501PAY5_9PROT|nr:nitroreductase [Emcibacter nanhaiensis]TPD57395.1 nitroreductase [Emcibacter nanhaiensis]
MSVIDAIKKRQSNGMIEDRDVPRELIEQILDAAVCTPVHYNTNPWRFQVLTGEARNRLGKYMAQCFVEGQPDPDAPAVQAKIPVIEKKALRAPVIIVVAAAKSSDPRAIEEEDVASATVSCQNILLAAEELGLACIWRTGSFTYGDRMRQLLGFADGARLAGFMYLGYPARQPAPVERPASYEFTEWFDD